MEWQVVDVLTPLPIRSVKCIGAQIDVSRGMAFADIQFCECTIRCDFPTGHMGDEGFVYSEEFSAAFKDCDFVRCIISGTDVK
jgi:hypothetical protein